jgi:chromosome condensin MukBEF complex kleisin-like MukF subunit
MLDNFLEPDQLALILARLRDTIDLNTGLKEERQKVVKDLIAGLRLTKRWGMTAMMMSRKEKDLGQEVWISAGGTGDWTKRT